MFEGSAYTDIKYTYMCLLLTDEIIEFFLRFYFDRVKLSASYYVQRKTIKYYVIIINLIVI